MTPRTLSLMVAATLGFAGPAMAAQPAKPAVASVATAPTATATAAPTLPGARIDDTVAVYRQWLQRMDEHHDIAGLATAMVVGNKVVFEDTVGYADARTHAPITPDTVFRLASLSKAFATAVTGLLVDSGKLDWDLPIAQVLPYFHLKDEAASQQATLRDILGQRLGLPPNTYDKQLEHNVPYESLVRQLDQVDMTCGVGQCYGYQNIAFSLIGDVVAAKTGTPLPDAVSQRIFAPLGMKTASYGLDALEASQNWAHPHRAAAGGNWVPFEPKEAYYRVAPAAGVNASLRDMEQWLVAQMGGRPDVLPPPLLATLHEPEVRTPAERNSAPWRHARVSNASYALGWRVFDYGGETLVFHAGAVDGYRTMIAFFPRYRVGMVTMWNSSSTAPTGLMPMVLDHLLGLPYADWADLGKPAKAKAANVAKSSAPPKKARSKTRTASRETNPQG